MADGGENLYGLDHSMSETRGQTWIQKGFIVYGHKFY